MACEVRPKRAVGSSSASVKEGNAHIHDCLAHIDESC